MIVSLGKGMSLVVPPCLSLTWAKYLQMSYVDKGSNYALMGHKNTQQIEAIL